MIRISDKELVEGFLAWSLVWLLRKIGMHAYLGIKKQNKIKERIFNII